MQQGQLERETMREKKGRRGTMGLGELDSISEDNMFATNAHAKKAARKLSKKKSKHKNRKKRRKSSKNLADDAADDRKHSKRKGSKHKSGLQRKQSQARMKRRGSQGRLQMAIDAEKARRAAAVADAAAVAVAVAHAGDSDAAVTQGKAKLRWLMAAQKIMAENRKGKGGGKGGGTFRKRSGSISRMDSVDVRAEMRAIHGEHQVDKMRLHMAHENNRAAQQEAMQRKIAERNLKRGGSGKMKMGGRKPTMMQHAAGPSAMSGGAHQMPPSFATMRGPPESFQSQMARHEADELATRAAIRAKQQKLANQHIERTKGGDQGTGNYIV